MLRLDWNILFNMINILILYLLMKRFLFKPVNDIIAKRQAEADAKLADARKAEESAEQSRRESEEIVRQMKQESSEILTKARAEGSAEYGKIIEEANEKAKKILEKAQLDAEREKETVLQQAEKEVREIVVDAVTRIAGANDSAEHDMALYDQFLQHNRES